MALSLKLSTSMSAAEIAPFWPDIIRCMEKFVARFPEDESIANILQKCMEGKRQLWLVYDEAQKVVLVAITEIAVVDATGERRLVFSETGGDRGLEALELMGEIEDWGRREFGVTASQWIGRRGWKKALETRGFREKATVWHKDLTQCN